MTADLAAADRLIRRGAWVTALALLGVAAIYYVAFAVAPPDRIQGPAFKILYVHAPSAWAAEMAFVIVGIVSILYLWLRDPRLDRFAEASAEVGMVFGTIILTSGPIWGRTSWGAWWRWEPRLTFTLFLYLLFAGYFAMRSSLQHSENRERFAAVVGIMGMLLVPFIHLTVYLFNSQHPMPVLMAPRKSPLPWEMLWPLLVGLGVFTLLYMGFVMVRYGIGQRRAALEVHDVS